MSSTIKTAPIDFSSLTACPKCQACWEGSLIPEESRWMFGNSRFFSRVIGIYDRDRDCTVAWQCPDCCGRWERATGRLIKKNDDVRLRPKEWR
jgi:hypothetical protein